MLLVKANNLATKKEKKIMAKNNTKVTSIGSSIFTASTQSDAPKKNIYEIVTENFINELKKGEIPWEKPWVVLSYKNGEDFRCGGWSHDTGKPYSLLNQMLLSKEGEYLTFKMVKDEGGKVKKGAKSHPIFYFKPIEIEQKNPKTNQLETVRVPMLKYYRVFHIDDTEGIEPKFKADMSALEGLKEPQKCKKAESIIKDYTDRELIKIYHKAQNEAYYSPIDDSITLPLKKQFKTKAEYYSTVFHELTHSTGAEDRLKRFHGAYDKKSYSLEELVAEIGASVMLKQLGIETKQSHKNNTAYIQSWLKALSNDTRMIVTAASKARKAVDLINNYQYVPQE